MPRFLLPLIALLLILPTTANADPTPPGAIVVNSVADTGERCDQGASECTLRGAIITANAKPGADTIAFNLALVTRIAPEKPLPAITQTVTIDGFTQAGLPQATRPMVELDGSLMALGAQAQAPAAKGAAAQPAPRPKAKATRAADDMIRFLRPWGLDLRDADGSTIRGLIIHDFPYSQIGLDGTDQATFTGNWLGLTPLGDAQTRTTVENERIGLTLINSAQATIGGVGRDRNVISGNDYGIVATDAGSRNSVILGNYIGATTDGLGKRPNRSTGILLTEPVGTSGRGTRENVVAGNVILGNAVSFGVSVLAATKTSVIGNFVGLNAAGQAKSPTGEPLGHDIGVYVHDSPETEVGGTGTAEYNLIAGNGLGIELNGGSNGSTVAGNRIGTDYDGKDLVDGSGNRSGVAIVADGESEAPADMTVTGNTIAGSSNYGMYVTGGPQRATITANRIGTDVDGVKALPNEVGFAAGYSPSGAGAPGTLTFGPSNVVAGNTTDGVQMLGGRDAVVRGNRIGVSADTKPLGNGSSGVLVEGDGVLVEANTVSANAQGVVVAGAADGVRVRANRIGTAPSGEPSPADFGNRGAGVLVGGTAPDYPANTRIGGSERNDANVISGNARGVQVHTDADDTTIRQNHIGVDTTGTKAIPNGVGITLQGGLRTVVGGALGIDARNVIAHNEDAGIRLNGAEQTTVIGNYITANDGPGVLADARGGDAIIGWSVQSDEPMDDIECRDTRCNRIEDNAGAGVRVEAGSRVTVRGNRMRGNSGLDVDLAGPGASANDEADVDAWLNAPTGVAPIKASGDRPDRVGGVLDTAEPHKTLVDVYGFTNTELLKGRPRGGEHIGVAFPSSSGQWFVDTPKRYAAYGAVVTDRHGTTSELSPACVGDADGDALCDNWETAGIDFDADGTADQTLPDASPAKPDIFVEVDWQKGRTPHMAALYRVKEAFELAPQPITLHTATDEEVPSNGPINTDGRSSGRNDDVADLTRGSELDPCDGYFGTAALRDDAKCAAKLGARKLAYRHAIFGDKELAGNTGAADPGGDAFVVTLGDFPREDVLLGGGSGEHGCNRQYDACLAEIEAAVFMHELGHTLGLLHGGEQTGENLEPNYLSVMNYLFMTRAVVANRPLDYSRQTLPPRNEAAFDERDAFAPAYPQRAEEAWTETAVTAYSPDDDMCRWYRVGLGQEPVEVHDPETHGIVAMGLNDPDGTPDPNGPEACQKPENHGAFTAIEDWPRLRYSRQALVGWDEDHYASEQPGEDDADAPLPSELAKLLDSDGDGRDDAQDVCPAVADPGQEDADGDGLGDACLPFITERDVDVKLEAASANVPVGQERTVDVVVSNSYPKPAAGAVVEVTPPAGVELVGGATRWEAGEIPARGSKKLTLTLRGVTEGRGELVAELIELADTDWDATPGNHDATEDDQAAKRLTVFQPGAVPAISVVALRSREGDDGERVARVRVELDGQTGMAVGARLRTIDGTAKAGEDYEPLDQPLEISPYSGERYVDVAVIGDAVDEPDETFTVELTGVDGATPDTVSGVVTIADDDDPLQPGQLGWLGCASRDYGSGGSCPQREPLLTSPWGSRALTPDGRFLFLPDDERLVRLTRDPATGGLSDAKCWTLAGPARGGCPVLGELDIEPTELLVSPDGTRLFVYGGAVIPGNGSAGLIALALDPATGEPSYDSCVGYGGPGCATELEGGTPILAPDGKHLLTVDGGARFDHGEITVYPVVDGHLRPAARCYAHPAENKPCEPLTVNLDGIPYLDFSPDGKTLAVRTKGHLALLGYDAAAGTLALDGGCVREGAGCRPATTCEHNRDKEFVCATPPDALASIGPVRFAADGRALYVASHDSNRVTSLPRTAERTWSLDGSMCAGRADTDCAVEADLVDEALEMVVSPDGGDVYVNGYGNGVTALRADRVTGALSEPRCAFGELGVGSCDRAYPQRSGAYSLSRGNMIIDPSGRDLYTTVWLPGTKLGIGRFLRVTRAPGGENRAPVCADADASVLPGATVELALRCVDPDGDAVTIRLTRGGGELLAGNRLRVKAGVSAGVEVVGFRASDGGLDSAEAQARIVVGNPPACQDARVSVMASERVTLPLQCDRGAVEIVERPIHGTVVGGTFTASWRDGTEVVRFAAYDPDTGVRSAVATVTVTVVPRPVPPPIVDFGTVTLENGRGGNSGCSGASCRPNGRGELPFPMRCNGSPTRTPGSCSGTLEACSPTGSCRGSTGRPTIARVRGSLGKVRFTIPVGKAKTVKLRLNKSARKELAKRGKLKVRIRTSVRLPDGRTVNTTKKLTLKRPLTKRGR